MKDLIHHNIIYETRYNFGYRYLDVCGETLKEIIESVHPFEINNAEPKQASIFDYEKNLTFNFNLYKCDLNQSQNSKVSQLLTIDNFSEYADKLTQILIKNFKIETINRIGCRHFFIKGFESEEKCNDFIFSLEAIKNIFKSDILKNLDELSFTFKFTEDTYNIRFRVTSGQQNVNIDPNLIALSQLEVEKMDKNQKKFRKDKLRAQRLIKNYPDKFVLFDIDIFDDLVDEVQEIDFRPFIINSYEKSHEYIKKFMGG